MSPVFMSRDPADRSFTFVELKEGIQAIGPLDWVELLKRHPFGCRMPVFLGDSQRESIRKPIQKLDEIERPNRLVVLPPKRRGMAV